MTSEEREKVVQEIIDRSLSILNHADLIEYFVSMQKMMYHKESSVFLNKKLEDLKKLLEGSE